jgi:propanol-preferring alcohol dehydrogenase
MTAAAATTDLAIPKTQLAAVSTAHDQPTTLQTVPVTQEADLEAGQALVKVLYSGVCMSDVTIVCDPNRAAGPCIAGHEGAGVVVAINDPRCVMKVGDRGECASGRGTSSRGVGCSVGVERGA